MNFSKEKPRFKWPFFSWFFSAHRFFPEIPGEIPTQKNRIAGFNENIIATFYLIIGIEDVAALCTFQNPYKPAFQSSQIK
jgi:hypothetical protein